MDILYILLYLVCQTLQLAQSLECYNCKNINDVNECINTTHCQYGQSCFLDVKHTENTPLYNLGCINNQNCGQPSGAVGELVGRDLTERQAQNCHECCSTDNCNKHLCEHLKPSACIDDAKADCSWLNTIVNICQDIQHAKTVCPKFCGLCSLVDGNWAEWTDWSACDVTCENGTQTKTRTCTNPSPVHGGLNCTGNDRQQKGCYKQLCPVHGGWSGWGQWETCSITCDTGIQTRHRNCSNPFPQRYGDHCFGDGMESRLCTPGPCANGGWTNWGQWTSCSVSCEGLKSRSRTCTNPRPSSTGLQCEGDSYEASSCNNPHCWNNILFRAKTIGDTSLSIGQTIVFNTTIINEGNGYDNTTGIFTAPVKGTYMLISQICGNPNDDFGYGVISNSVEINRETLYLDQNHCHSVDTIAILDKGSSVFLRTVTPGNLFQNSAYVNMFSGVLIHLDK